ncbi:MAG: hypothetical protein ACLUKN_01120 [Bacilli bacterium]
MAGSKTKYVSMVVLMLTALVGVAGGGAFAISLDERRQVEIGNGIRKYEQQCRTYARQRRTKRQDSQQENPVYLSRRAAPAFSALKFGVIWAYENYAGGRVEFSGKRSGLVSFKIGQIYAGG